MMTFFQKTDNRKTLRITAIAILLAVLAVLALLSSGCEKKAAPLKPVKKATKTDAGIHKTWERGPAKCIIDIDKSEITIADRLHFTMTVITDDDYSVTLPAAGEKLSGFGIKDFHTSAPGLTKDGKKKIGRTYVLEPFLSGDYVIPEMTIYFWKTGKEEKNAHKLETEKITIHVRSVLPKKLKDLKIADIRPPGQMPEKISKWIWISAGGAAILLLCGIGFIIYRRRHATVINAELLVPPHERAIAALEELVSKNLVEKGETKAFYQEISDILRRYIENRFGINAPEQTTKEFLAGLNQNDDFPVKFRGLLKDFLTHCDMVKFAAFMPSEKDIQETFDSCKTFIWETRGQDTRGRKQDTAL
ncbi:MAG: DUF4381 family protein [Deltaproteobacteria bacterium]|nr:DUF4381 family protein [Deltaproteobacteria bacterium]